MKKLIVSFVTGLFIIGAAASSASAATHLVEKGDTLWSIAQENNTSVSAIMNENGLDSDLIFPGQALSIDGEASKEVHVVSFGDTLYKVAVANGVSVNNLKAWNGLTSDWIYPGERLVLNGTAAPVSEPAPKPEPKQATTKVKTAQESSSSSEVAASQAPAGQTITVSATAYTANCAGCSGITATGINLNKDRDAKVIAVDPAVIPLGSEVYVEGYGRAIAGDTGGAINGHKIDLHVPTKSDAFSWGVRQVQVTILD